MRRLIVYLLFFLSGAAGLVYQVVWMRKLTLIVGVTSVAVATVLAVFMGGLALGSWLMGRAGDETRAPLRLYGWMELGIGLFGVQALFLFDGLLEVYVPIQEATGAWFPAARFGLAALALLGPTTLMGATLPILIKGVSQGEGRVARDTGFLYAINTLGAVAGTLAAAFLLVPNLGMWRTNLVAVGLNVFVGIAALRLQSSREARAAREGLVSAAAGGHPLLRGEEESGHAVVDAPLHGAQRGERALPRDLGSRVAVGRDTAAAVVLAFGVSGFLALAYEVVWTRYLIFVLGENSVYAFASMLAAFLIGIALGSFFAALIADRVQDRVALLGGVFVLLGGAAASTVTLMGPLAGWRPFELGGFWGDSLNRLTVCLAALIVPTTLSGSTFAIVAKVYAQRHASLAADAGRAYAVNTLGAIFGAAAGGFLVLPYLGLVHGILVLAAVQVLLGVLLLLRERPLVLGGGRPMGTLVVTGVLTAAAFWAALFHAKSPLEIQFGDRIDQVVFYADGAESTVAVIQDPDSGHLHIQVDGEGQAGTDPEMQIHLRLLGHLPAIFHPDPKSGLVVAFGAGVTTGCLTQHPVELVDQVELSPHVVEASPHFAPWNHDPLPWVHADPAVRADVRAAAKVKLHVDDGRNFLLSTDRRWDVITSDPIDADDAGTTSLYCKEYFELVREHLNDGGLACQWITPGYGREGFFALVRTFQHVFPYTAIWHAEFTTVVVGFKDQPRMTMDDLRAKFDDPKVRDSLAFIGVDSAETLLNMMLLGPDEVRELVGAEGPGRPLNTDDFPLIEYLRRGMRGGSGGERDTSWEEVLALRSLDHSDWIVDWSAEDEASLQRGEPWMQAHLRRFEREVAETERLLGRGAEDEGELSVAEREERYLAGAAEREAQALAELDEALRVLVEDAPPIFRIMAGFGETDSEPFASPEQAAAWDADVAAALALWRAGDYTAAVPALEVLAATRPDRRAPETLAVVGRLRLGEPLLALRALLTSEGLTGWTRSRYLGPILAAVLTAMDAGDEEQRRAIGRELLVLLPSDGERPDLDDVSGAEFRRRAMLGDGPRPLPTGAAIADPSAWRLWWSDMGPFLDVEDGQFVWAGTGHGEGF